MSTPNFDQIAEEFDIHVSVIENLYEEFISESECFNFEDDYTFRDYLVEEFAQAAFIFAAIEGGDAVDCLEAYDTAYSVLTDND